MIKEQYISQVIDTTLNIVNSKIDSVRSKNITKTSQRVYVDGFIGVSGAIGSFNQDTLLDEAKEALEKRIDYSVKPETCYIRRIDKRQPILHPEELVFEFDSFLAELRDRQPGFIFSNKISLSEIKASIINDAGLSLEYADKCISAGIVFKEKASTSVFDGSIGFMERRYDKKLILDEFDLFLNSYKEKVTLPKNGRYPVLFFSEEAPVDKFISDLHADVFMKGGSIFSGKTGEKLFNETFTFGQNLDPEITYNRSFFDSEGFVNPNFTFNLIQDGVINAPYCDKKTARKYGISPSGSAAAPYDGVHQTSFLRPYIKSTCHNIKAMLGGQPGIFVLMAAGGDFTPQGDYATPVQLAMLFDGERFLGRLPEFSLSSNIYDMFGNGYRGTAKNSFLPFSTGDVTVLEMNIASV